MEKERSGSLWLAASSILRRPRPQVEWVDGHKSEGGDWKGGRGESCSCVLMLLLLVVVVVVMLLLLPLRHLKSICQFRFQRERGRPGAAGWGISIRRQQWPRAEWSGEKRGRGRERVCA